MAEALYRKYRPQVFADVVGQEHIERTLKNAIEQDKVSHAYLFTGPRGTGKTTTARLLAKALLCESGPTSQPDGTCEDCTLIANGEHPDVFELDAASRTGVENVREEIIGRVDYAPTRGRYKVYIIDEVHMLSTAAFNALLKTLEEPPSHVVFILATTDPQKVPETIHSRCQRFDFRRISAESIVSRLGAICVSEGVEFEGEALDLIAHRAEGGMRNALTSLEQLIAFGNGAVTMEVAERMLGSLDASDLAEIVRFIGQRDAAECFKWTADFVETGADLAQFTRDLAEHMRNLYVMSLAGDDVALDVGETQRRELSGELPMYGPDRLARILTVLGDLLQELKTSTNPRLSFEIALTRMIRPETDLTLESLAERLERLESGGLQTAAACASSPGIPASAPSMEAPRPSVQSAPQSAGDIALAQPSSAAPSPDSPASAAAVRSMQSAPTPDRTSEVPSQAASGAVVPTAPQGCMSAAAAPAQTATGDSVRIEANPGVLSAKMDRALRNPATLQRLVQKSLDLLKKDDKAIHVMFMNTKVTMDEGNHLLVFDFTETTEFAFNAARKPDAVARLTAALAQIAQEPIPYVIVRTASRSEAVAPVSQTSVPQSAVSSFAPPVQTPAAAPAVRPSTDTAAASPSSPSVAAASAEPSHVQGSETADAPAPDALSHAAPEPVAYDEVPTDAYDAYGMYEGDIPEPASAEPAPEFRPPAPAPDIAAASPTTQTSAASENAAHEEPTVEDLNACLSVFGDGTVFEPVD